MGLLDIWSKDNEKEKRPNYLNDEEIEEWEKEAAEAKEIAEGSIWTKDYGWRSKEWLAKHANKKNKKKAKYNKEQNDKIMEAYEKGLAEGAKRYAVGDMRYGYGAERYILDDDYYGSYDYSFNKKISGGTSYDTTGEWKGYNYYKKATVDYKYIEQMANAFSAQHDIKVRVGKKWCIDLKKKEMMYDPTSLMFGTKADVIVRLLHEIGHLRYSSPAEDLTGPYRNKYKEACHNVWNALEDVRIDEKMMKAYEGAPEVYEALKKERAETAKDFEKKAKEIRNRAITATENIPSLANMPDAELQDYCKSYKLDYTKVKALLGGGHTEMVDNLMKLSIKKMDEANIYDYAYGMLLRGNGHPIEETPLGVREEIQKTDHVIDKIKIAETSQDVMDILEKEVFPIIEKLLKNHKEGTEEDQALFGPKAAQNIQNGGNKTMPTHGTRFNPGHTDTPEEWREGDYAAMKESVDSAIKELTRKLKNVRAKDLTPSWKRDQTRGKLNIKAIHRYPAGRFDIFKKKELKTDRTKNFIFSIIVDTSGSMSGDKIINAVRGSIILAEVFKNLDMPFEVMGFDYDANIVKGFDDKFDNKKKAKIGKMVYADGGSTNLDEAFKASKIINRPEKNKYVIVLTDGQTSGFWECCQMMKDWQTKHSVTPIGLNLQLGYNQLSQIMGEKNTKDVEEANELPIIFEGIIKNIISKLK